MSVRAVVFKVRDNPYAGTGWTWCFEVDGEPLDKAWELPKPRDDWRAVLTEATTGVVDVRAHSLLSQVRDGR